MFSPVSLLIDLPVVIISDPARAGIDLEGLAGFGIDKTRQPDIGQISLAWVFYCHGDDVMPLRENLQRSLDVGRVEIRDQENDCLLAERTGEVACESGDVRSAADRLKSQDIAKDAQHVLTAFARWDDVFDAIGEQHNTNAVVVAHGGHRENSGKLSCKLALESSDCSESLRSGEIDGEHDRELPLFDVAFDEWTPHARRDVPVDCSDFIAGLIFANLGKFHSLALEHTSVLARKQRVDETARSQLDELYLPEYLWRDALPYGLAAGRRGMRGLTLAILFFVTASTENRAALLARLVFAPCNRIDSATTPADRRPASDHGAGTAARIRLTIVSLVTSSASAS